MILVCKEGRVGRRAPRKGIKGESVWEEGMKEKGREGKGEGSKQVSRKARKDGGKERLNEEDKQGRENQGRRRGCKQGWRENMIKGYCSYDESDLASSIYQRAHTKVRLL